MAAEPPPATTVEPPATMAAVTPPADDAATQPPTMAAEPPATMVLEPPATMAAEPPADSGKTPPAGPAVPTFDVVRVEADGSVVIAGKAAPDAQVELLSGATVLASTKASAGRRFRDRARRAAEARRLPDHLARHPARRRCGGVARDRRAVYPRDAGRAGSRHGRAAGRGERDIDCATPEAPAAPAPQSPRSKRWQRRRPMHAPKTEAAAPPATTEPQPPAVAAVTPPATDQPAPAPAPAEVKVTVEAVEIEGPKIFVAGSSEPGRMIRAYANEIVLGETRVSSGGRFLVEAERDLPVGNYIIRADVLDSDGVKVIARAAVPFEREPGEDIAAVAPPADAAAEPPATVAAAEPARAGDRNATGCRCAEPPAAEPAAPATETPPAVAAPTAQPAAPATETPPAVAAAEPAAPAAETPPAVAAAEPAAPATDAPATETPPAVAAAEPLRPQRRRLPSTLRQRRRRRRPRRSCRRCRAPSSFAAATRCGGYRAASTAMACAIRRSISPTRSRSAIPTASGPARCSGCRKRPRKARRPI